MQQIGFQDLKVKCIIGLLEEERLSEQLLSIDLAVETKDYIDYTELANLVRLMAETGQFLLLETLADETIKALYKKWPSIEEVSITIKKPRALSEAAYAFVRMKR